MRCYRSLEQETADQKYFIRERVCAGIWRIKLYDITEKRLFLIWDFDSNFDTWDFGIEYTIICIREKIRMKHVVKMMAYVETENTDLKEIGKIGLENIIKQIESGFCVVDVLRGCTSVEAVCVNIASDEQAKKAYQELRDKEKEGKKDAS